MYPRAFRVVLGTLLLVGLLAGLPGARGDDSWRVYDLRDLNPLLGQTAPSGPSTLGTLFGDGGGGMMAGGAVPGFMLPAEGEAPTDRLMSQMESIGSLGQYRCLTSGVYLVQAEDEGHERLTHVLDALRALYLERYVLELAWHDVAACEAPVVGAVAPPPELVNRHQVVLARRTPTPVESTEAQTYLATYEPVVGTSVSEVRPVAAQAESGLRALVTVGAGPEDEKGTSVDLLGLFQNVALRSAGDAVASGAARFGPIGLPTVARRSVAGSWPVKYGEPTVIAVVSGFEDSRVIVVTATVRKCSE
jgi:hypothetical protein